MIMLKLAYFLHRSGNHVRLATVCKPYFRLSCRQQQNSMRVILFDPMACALCCSDIYFKQRFFP